MSKEPLGLIFLDSVPAEVAFGDADGIDKVLAQILDSARRDWPDVTLDDETFVAYLATHCAEGETAMRSIKKMETSDLFVACAAGRGDNAAVEAIETSFFPAVDWAMAKMRLDPTSSADLKQMVREKVFVCGNSSGMPLIAQYAGRGKLSSWLRVLTVRVAGRYLDKKRKEVPVEDEYLTNAIDIDANDVELAKLQGLYHKEFKEAFREALSLLENDEKRLLRQNFVEGLSVEKIGDLHDVHRSTAARWVVQARTQLLENTRRLLMEKLSIRGDTCDSIIRLLSPNLDITFQSYLNTRVAPGVRDDDS